MSEQLRRMENERKSKDYTRKSKKSQFLNKEFSLPVKAANTMLARKMSDEILKAEKTSKISQFRYDRECDYINDLRKRLTVKLKDFDSEKFHQERLRNRKSCDFHISNEDIISMMMDVPTNSVLDFGPGNRAFHTMDPELRRVTKSKKGERILKRPKQHVQPYTKQSWQKKNIKSKYSKYFRAQSAKIPHRSSTENTSKVRPKTSMPRISTHGDVHQDLKWQSLRSNANLAPSMCSKPYVNFSHASNYVSDTSSEVSTATSKSDAYKRCKSYRMLKTMLTYTAEDETPLPDPREEFKKKCKNMESLNFRSLQKKIDTFLNSCNFKAGRRNEFK